MKKRFHEWLKHPKILSVNQRIKQFNQRKTMLVLGGLLAIGAIIYVMLPASKSPTSHSHVTPHHTVKFVGPISEEYGNKEIQSAIFGQQMRSDETAKHTRDLAEQVKKQQARLNQLHQQLSTLNAKLVTLAHRQPTTPSVVASSKKPMLSPHLLPNRQLVSTMPPQSSAHWRSSPHPFPMASHAVYTVLAVPPIQPLSTHPTAMQWVPSGTFARAVLLSGADANASVKGTMNTDPILLRILDNGTLPNGKHSTLKGCFVTASIYGDISSERGQIRTALLSCVRAHGQLLNVAVKGTVVGSGGKNGLRGIPVMRNGKILWNAGLAGGIAGFGSAAQANQENQSTSPLGTVTTVGGNFATYAAYGALKRSSDMLARYYIDRAEQYHPIIQINPGSVVTIIFLKPFSLSTQQPLAGMKNSPAAQASPTPKTTAPASVGITLTPQQRAAYQHYLQHVITQQQANPTMIHSVPTLSPAIQLPSGATS